MKKYFEIGNRLRHLRAHLSQKEFAEKIGITPQAYQNYEYGKRMPKGDVLLRIAGLCDVSVDWILSGVAKKEKTDTEMLEDIRKSAWREGKKLTKEEEQRRLESSRKIQKKFLEIKPDFDSFPKYYSYYRLTNKVKRIYKEGDKVKIEALKSLLNALDPGSDEAVKEEELEKKLKEGAA